MLWIGQQASGTGIPKDQDEGHGLILGLKFDGLNNEASVFERIGYWEGICLRNTFQVTEVKELVIV